MSNFFDGFLNSVFGADGYMKDFQHASRLYRSERFYDLAPKAGWLYYIRFNINLENQYVANSLNKTWRERYLKRNTIGLLAKSVDLPKFNISSETVNQYNRRTVVQTKLTYSPINIVFHDDMANSTTDFWKQYYSYHFADATASRKSEAKGSTNSTEFSDNKYDYNTYSYGLSNGQKVDPVNGKSSKFFNSIEIYQLNKKKYNSITLVNPVIKDWSHGSHQQNQSNFLESRMSVEYETVFYKDGVTSKDVGFTDNFYDKNPSPNQVAGGLFGVGGVINGSAEVFGDISNINAETSYQDLFQLGLKTAALVKNIPEAIQNAKAEGYSILAGTLANAAQSGSFANYADQYTNDPNYSGIRRVGSSVVELYKGYRSSGNNGTEAKQNT